MVRAGVNAKLTGKNALMMDFSFLRAVSMIRIHDLAALVHKAREENDRGDGSRIEVMKGRCMMICRL